MNAFPDAAVPPPGVPNKPEIPSKTDVSNSRAGERCLAIDGQGKPISRPDVAFDGPEGKGDKEALGQREELFAKAFRSSPVALVITRLADGRLIDVNEAFMSLCGYARPELIGRTSLELGLVTPEERDAFRSAVSEHGQLRQREMMLGSKNGQQHWVLASAEPIQLGQDTCLIWTGFDISARKRAEEALAADLAALTRIHELSRKSLEAGLQPLLQEIMDAAVAIVRAERGTLQLIEADSLRIVAHHAHEAAFLEFFASAETRASVCGEATRRGERVVVPDVEASPLFAGTPSLEVFHQAHVRAVQSTPIISRAGGLLGILTTQWSTPYSPDEHDLRRIDLLVRQAADLIEQTRAEKALRESRNKYQALIETTADFIWEMDSGGKYTYCSPQMEKLWGLKPEDMIGKTPFDRMPAEQQATAAAAFAALVKLPQPFGRLESAAYDQQGRVIFIEATGVPFFDEHGQLGGYRGISRDITERKRAEEALRQSEEQFRALADSIPNLAWWANGDGYLTWYNRRWYEYTGTTPEQMEGWGWQSVHDPKLLPNVLERWRTSIATGEPLEMEFPLRGADGRFRWFLTRVMPVRDSEGNVRRWFGTNTDVSEIRAAREVLARDKGQLERLVAERTAKLQELIGELEHFSYTITHDMRAPLRAMYGFAELLMEECAECPAQGTKAFSRRIAASAARMDLLITDALNYSRAVRQELTLTRVDPGALLRSMLDSYPEFQPPKAQIEIQGEIPLVMGNEAGLTQCFSNLLGNAVKFVKPGEKPQIRVWAAQRGDRIRIWVEDEGIGISKSMQPRVFDMFSRGHEGYDGTGIGLALVRKVMDRMDGKVGLESEEGKGSRFWLELKPAK